MKFNSVTVSLFKGWAYMSIRRRLTSRQGKYMEGNGQSALSL